MATRRGGAKSDKGLLASSSNGHHSPPQIGTHSGLNGSATNNPKSKRKMLISFLLGACCTALFFLSHRDASECGYGAVKDYGKDKEEGDSASTSSDTSLRKSNAANIESTSTTTEAGLNDWKWYEGDVNQYYNDLEKDHNRDPTSINKYAVHRWMGEDRSTEHHYELILESIMRYTGLSNSNGAQNLKVLDGGCGLGSAMMWLEQQNPTWKLIGHTLSEEQAKFINEKLPAHKFEVALKSFDDLEDTYDVIYAIEAMIHSYDIDKTFSAWASHLHPEHGSLVIIDDFLLPGTDPDDPEVEFMRRGWMANTLVTVSELNKIGRKYGIELVESRDLVAEFRVVDLNYNNQIPDLTPDKNRNHQGWMGSKYRHKLTVEGKVGYSMVVFRKIGAKKPARSLELGLLGHDAKSLALTATEDDPQECQAVPSLAAGQSNGYDNPIIPKEECISAWYCCDKGLQYFDNMQAHRTDQHGFLKLERDWFGNYMETFARHLNNFYKTLPADYKGGRFLDIGATGSTASGMTQVTTKFQHFAGPLEYWMLDSDQGARTLDRTIYCDIVDCPQADTCGFDVTFSHTVLEHASHPDKTFDTIARLTKKGGITMHLVPWSYQYHATPDDYYRFSHSALRVLMEDRGFEPLEIGYDLCSKPENMKRKVDEHYDFIWLTYVVARKK